MKFIKSRAYISLAALLVIASLGFWYFNGNEDEIQETVTVKKGNVVQEVSVTGKVKPVQEVDLSFEKSGKVARINAEVGDNVKAGSVLMSLENGDLSASLNQAKAQLKIDDAKLAELSKGSRQEDIDIKQAELDKARQDLENYYNDVLNTLSNAYVTADDAARVKTAGIFSGFKTTSYKLTYTSCSTSETDATLLRLKSEDELDKWKSELAVLSEDSPRAESESALRLSKDHLAVIKSLLDRTSETLSTGCTTNDASLDTYRKNVSTARTNLVSAETDVNTLIQNIAAQKITITKIDSELKLKLAGNTKEQLDAQKAQVEYSGARVESAEAELLKTIIRAPFNGIVTKQDGKLGAIASVNTPILSMISEEQFEVEAFIPEADITKITEGEATKITLDAFGGGVVFDATVALIPPSETVIEGVPTYKVLFKFAKESNQVKSGMTANIIIETGRKTDVLAVPQRSVINKDGGAAVKVLQKDGTAVTRPVSLGLRGSFGEIEITSGLNEGDQVLLFPK